MIKYLLDVKNVFVGINGLRPQINKTSARLLLETCQYSIFSTKPDTPLVFASLPFDSLRVAVHFYESHFAVFWLFDFFFSLSLDRYFHQNPLNVSVIANVRVLRRVFLSPSKRNKHAYALTLHSLPHKHAHREPFVKSGSCCIMIIVFRTKKTSYYLWNFIETHSPEL